MSAVGGAAPGAGRVTPIVAIDRGAAEISNSRATTVSNAATFSSIAPA